VCIRATEAAIYVARADYALLYLERPGGDGLWLRAARGPEDPRARLLDQRVATGLAVEVASSGEIALRSKAPADVALFEVVGESLGAMIAAPLRWQGKVIGVLAAARRPGETAFGEYDTEWLSGLADYAAIAVQNARTYEARARQPRGEPVLTPEQLEAFHAQLAQLANQLAAAAETVLDIIDSLPQTRE
jgi:two-component system NtrC family sensor kinase